MTWFRLLLFGFGLTLTATTAALAAFLPEERLEIASTLFSDEDFLTGAAAAGAAVTLAARLSLPEGNGPHPVVILLHGSNGGAAESASDISSVVVRSVLRQGYATLLIDSFGGRGFEEIATDQDRVTQFAQIYDAFRAIEVLAADPRVDASRIVLLGFSRGGAATLYAALQRFHELYGPKAGRIVGYLPFYPACNFELARGTEMVAAPIRQFHGADDDWTSAATCKTYVDSLASAGADIELTIYDGAKHSFDGAIVSRFPLRQDDAQTSFDCMRVEQDGVLVNRDTGQPFTYKDACVRTGVTVQANRAAGEAAAAQVEVWLKDWVGAP